MKKTWWEISLATLVIIAYILITGKFIADEKFFILAVPFVLMVGMFVLFKMDKALLLIYFLTPLSIPLREYFPNLGIDMYLPTEPFLVLLSLLFIAKLFIDKQNNREIYKHPVTLSILFSIFWILLTSITSTVPAVSFKFLGSRLWFLIPFFFLALALFIEKKNIHRFLLLYGSALVIVVFFTINKHLAYGLNDQEASNWVCSPFYNDHTSYGAALAMIIFGLIPVLISKAASIKIKYFTAFLLAILLFALVYSYSRAAWLSVIGALGVLSLVILKIRFKWVALVTIVVVTAGIIFYNDIMYSLEKNDQDSSGNFNQHISSITNITTDASNVERLNRWSSAIRMFKDKPLFGWGPGTYMFQYAPFQYSRERTIISTNSGDGGNAHSEYLGPLSESGLLGPIYFLLIGIFSLLTGFRIYHTSKDNDVRYMALFLTLGLITYLLHSFLNNFLDTDKLSALFWGFIAVLVSLDLKLKKESAKS